MWWNVTLLVLILFILLGAMYLILHTSMSDEDIKKMMEDDDWFKKS